MPNPVANDRLTPLGSGAEIFKISATENNNRAFNNAEKAYTPLNFLKSNVLSMSY